MEFDGLGRRAVMGRFDGGPISSGSGGVLLREVEQCTQILERLAGCFVDYRDAGPVEHDLESLIKQRVMGLALGYEDLNDHDVLRRDPLLALLSGKSDPSGATRKRERDKGCALAGKSTLNRLELTPDDADEESRYKKIVVQPAAMDALFVELFLEAHESAPEEIILDVDATDDPIHGEQEGRFFSRLLSQLLLPCRCTSFVGSICGARGCAPPTRTGRQARWRSWSASSVESPGGGPRYGLSCGVIRAFAGMSR